MIQNQKKKTKKQGGSNILPLKNVVCQQAAWVSQEALL